MIPNSGSNVHLDDHRFKLGSSIVGVLKLKNVALGVLIDRKVVPAPDSYNIRAPGEGSWLYTTCRLTGKQRILASLRLAVYLCI